MMTATNARVTPLGAIDQCNQARARHGDDPTLLRRLAQAHEDAGHWSAACHVLRELIEKYGEQQGSIYALARCLEKSGRIPFELRDGQPIVTRADSESLLREATERLAKTLANRPRRVSRLRRLVGRLARRKRVYQIATWRPGVAERVHRRVTSPEAGIRKLYELGQMYERAGEFEKAAETYSTAVRELQTVDATWVHRAEPAWRFRLAYVQQRLIEPTEGDARLLRTATPVPPVGPTTDQPPGGFFDASITDTGLRVSGFLLPGCGDAVDICVEGSALRRVIASTEAWLPTFQLEITHTALDVFPSRAQLTARTAEGQQLMSAAGGQEIELRVPGASGRLADLLASGYALTKKGSLAPPVADNSRNYELYLDAYCEVKRQFESLLGKKLFLTYGTLLGCYRDGSFITGDDDFDVAYVAESSDPVELKIELQRAALSLLNAGYDIAVTQTGRLFKIRFLDVWLDINPIWFHGGRAWSFNVHNIERTVIEPIRSMDFMGREVYVPCDVESFLEDNYGPAWRVPQPGFRYYRTEADRRVLRRSWLTPREVRRLAQRAELVRQRNPGAGCFEGVGLPSETGFTWGEGGV